MSVAAHIGNLKLLSLGVRVVPISRGRYADMRKANLKLQQINYRSFTSILLTTLAPA